MVAAVVTPSLQEKEKDKTEELKGVLVLGLESSALRKENSPLKSRWLLLLGDNLPHWAGPVVGAGLVARCLRSPGLDGEQPVLRLTSEASGATGYLYRGISQDGEYHFVFDLFRRTITGAGRHESGRHTTHN